MIGKEILHYQILKKLGEGGMGEVYLAEDTKLKRKVAIKVLPSPLTKDKESRERLEREAQAAAALNHPNIVTIHEIGEYEDSATVDKQIFISMEYVEGVTLRAKIDNCKSKSTEFPIEEFINIVIQISEGLEKAHQAGIVHRDIKPANILFSTDGVAKIVDFGLAKLFGKTQITQLGTIIGTCNYMSPEQARGEEVDQRTDIWSLGVILYEMLTGTLPFNADYDQAIIYSILNEEPDLNNIPTELKSILKKTVNKDIRERYQKVEDLIVDLEDLKNKSSEKYRSSIIEFSSGSKFYTKKIIVSMFVLVLVLLFASYFIFDKIDSLNVAQKSAQQTPEKSLAVMYFENIPDPEDANHTGEMLTNLLITSLSQAKGMDVISRERLLNIQKDLGQVETKNLSPIYAEQVAHQANANTMLIGSIVQENPKLAITTRLIDVETGRIIQSHQIMRFSGDQIFNLVDSLSYLLLTDFQISSLSTSEVKPVSEVTTSSPEAYRAYVEGIDLFNKIYLDEAMAAFERAIELDNNFAMAYSYLSLLTVDPEKRYELFQKAVKLVDNITERERLYILANNFIFHNNPYKAIELLETLIKKYPHEVRAYELLAQVYKNTLLKPERGVEVLKLGLKNNSSAKHMMNMLVYFLTFLDRKEEALNLVNDYLKLAPAEPNPYDAKGDIYALFSEYDSSRAAYKKSFELRSDFSANQLGMFDVLSGQYNDAERYFEISRNKNPVIELHKGQINKAISKLNSSMISEDNNLHFILCMIPLCNEVGQYRQMLQLTRQGSLMLKKDPTNRFYGRNYIAWALVKNGNSLEAQALLDDLQNNLGSLTPVSQVIIDYTSAVISFEEKNYHVALQKLQKVFAAIPPNHWPSIYFAVSLLKCDKIPEAIEVLQRIVSFPPLYGAAIWAIPGYFEQWPIPAVKAHYWLGVAYEKQGKTDKALNEYTKFLDIWKDADFNSPELNDAKERVLKLRRISKK